MDENEIRSGDGAVADQVIEELRRVAFASFGDVAEVIDAEDWLAGIPLEELAAVASVKVKPSGGGMERDVKMYDKLRALEMLAKILGLYSEDARMEGIVPVIVDDLPREKKEGQK